MSIGLRKDRAALFAYQDLGSLGQIQSTYVQLEGPLADKKWWCRLEDVSGQQNTIASKAEEHIDAVIFFHQDVSVPAKGCIQIEQVLFKILNVRPRPSTQEQAVYCVFVDDPDFTLSATGSLIQPVSTSFSIVPTTSSHAATADTASYALFSVVSPSTNSFSLNSDLAISASHALTASFAPQSTTASLALFAVSGTGHFEGVFSGSFVGTSSIRRFTFPFTDAAPFEMFLVSQSGETEYQTQGRKKFDLTNFTQSRITAQVVVTGSVSAAIGFQYSLNEGASWAYLDGLSGPTASIATLGPVSSSYVDITAPAKTDVLLRWVAVSGSGTETPVIGNVCLGLIQDATIVANTALSASWTLSSSFADQALHADTATSATYALSSSHALDADTATSASHALASDVAITASFANEVLKATGGFMVTSSLRVSGTVSVTGTFDSTGPVTASAVKIDGIGGAGYIIFPTQSVDPATPPVGNLLIHATDENGFSRLGINNEAATDIVLARDMVMIARNQSGAAINKGNLVFISGSSGNNPTIGLAHASASETTPAFGYTLTNIANNAYGPVLMQGILTGLNTTGSAVNDRLYLSPTVAGAYTTTRPTNPNFVQAVGTVLVVHATQGRIAVNIANSLLNRETGTNQLSWTASGAVTASAFQGNGAGITGVVSASFADETLKASGGFRVSQSLQVTGSATASSLLIAGTGGDGYILLRGQSSNPAAPVAGTALIHAATTNGFTRIEQDNEGTVNLVLGRDSVVICKNTSGVNIPKGNLVYITGATGNNPTIARAIASASATMPAVGMAMDAIADNQFGQIMRTGILTSVTTTTYNAGDELYVSPISAGEFTSTRPSNPNYVQRVGTVLVAAANGTIDVAIAPAVLNTETGTNQASWTAAGAVTASAFKGDGAGITGVVSVQSASTALHALSSDTAGLAQFSTQSLDSYHAITASFAHQARSGTFADHALSANTDISSSHSLIADAVNGQGSGSFTGSFLGNVTGTFTGSYTGTFIGDGTSVLNVISASWASRSISSSNADTASNAVTSSYALRTGIALSGTGSFTGSFIGQHTGALQLQINSEQSGSQFTHQRIDLGAKSANFTISFDSGNIQRFRADAALQFDIANLRPGGFYVVEMTNNGAFVVTLPNGLLYPNGLTFSGSAQSGSVDVYTFYQAGTRTIVSPFAQSAV